MKQVKKCVIPAAGMGTRFLPATKALPKEMFPIVDKPVMQYIVEEAIAAGCEEIIIVTGRSKRAIEDHFDSNPELEQRLNESGKFDYLKKIKGVAEGVNIVYVRQPYPRGDGDAILRVKNLIGDEPFFVLFGDVIIDNNVNALEQMIQKYNTTNSTVIGTVEVCEEEKGNYGILETLQDGKVTEFIEKPKPGITNSCTSAAGKYILTPEIFRYLENSKSMLADGENRLADAFTSMKKEQEIFSCELKGEVFDTGNKTGFITANIHYAMKDPELKEELQKYLKNSGLC